MAALTGEPPPGCVNILPGRLNFLPRSLNFVPEIANRIPGRANFLPADAKRMPRQLDLIQVRSSRVKGIVNFLPSAFNRNDAVQTRSPHAKVAKDAKDSIISFWERPHQTVARVWRLNRPGHRLLCALRALCVRFLLHGSGLSRTRRAPMTRCEHRQT